jgi:hypothetical protein
MKTRKYSYRKALREFMQNLLDDYVYHVMISKKLKEGLKLDA